MAAPARSHALSELAERFGLGLRGDGGTLIHGVGTLAGAGAGQLAFLANAKYRKELARELARQTARPAALATDLPGAT